MPGLMTLLALCCHLSSVCSPCDPHSSSFSSPIALKMKDVGMEHSEWSDERRV